MPISPDIINRIVEENYLNPVLVFPDIINKILEGNCLNLVPIYPDINITTEGNCLSTVRHFLKTLIKSSKETVLIQCPYLLTSLIKSSNDEGRQYGYNVESLESEFFRRK